ncbi:MAG: beta-CASP ribonuclease aCPSF1 [Candidatus Hodarchaeaceae archaeon]|nr:beta-CASP ribonuclease aCPSF1 [Candidatus Hodarchaeaceae archaeon]
MAAEELLKEIKRIVQEETPFADAVSDIDFEGPKVVLYCKNLDLLMENGEMIKDLARKIRKRIILRPDPSLLTDKEQAEAQIRKLVPEEAGITDIIFSEDVGEVTIEAEKPGIVIGKGGALLRDLMHKTNWTPRVVRAPPIKSSIVRNIRLSMIQAGSARRDILRKIGRRIHREQKAKGDWVRFTVLGGGREVGRSCFLLQTPESKVMVDCGVNVASEDRAFPHLEVPEVRLPELDAVILSHAHLDHCGFVPYIFKYGFEGPVYCTPATRDLAVLLQLDYVEIAEREDKPMPYTKRDIATFLSHCIPLDYGDVTDISPDVRVTFHNAGHILGSSILHFHIGEGLYNIVYSGDLKFDRTRLFSPATYTFPRAETLIIDSTYGGGEDIQPYRVNAEKEFLRTVTETIKRGGKVVVPAFAVGRAQEIMVLLEDSKRNGILNGAPVYLDGMIWEATAIHTAYPEYLSPELRERIFRAEENPFLSEMFVKVSGPDQRAQVIDGEPAVIISTAGMMAGGPVLEYFKNLAPDPRNTLVFVGYQCEGSLGRRIQKGWREVPLRGEKGKVEEVKVNMEVKTIEGFSGHSDRAQLLNYVRRLSPKPERIVNVHGDENKCVDLASALHKLFRAETRAPLNLETLRLH